MFLLYGPRATWRVTVATGQGEESVLVDARPKRALGSCVGKPAEVEPSLRFSHAGRIAELVLPGFGADLSEEYASWFDSLARRRTQVLIIDLRDNGGGLDSNGSRLVAHLNRAPFPYYDSIQVNTLHPPAPYQEFGALLAPWRIERQVDGRLLFTGHTGLGVQQPRTPTFTGEVVVLVNGGTFSAASEVAAVLAAQGRATFIGEEAGGAANGNTAGVTAHLTLPHSRIRVQVPMMRYDVVAPGLAHGRGVHPAVPIHASLADVVAGRDPVRERAIAVARARLAREAP
jgi:C-terminal processing protease CtpA/Prc